MHSSTISNQQTMSTNKPRALTTTFIKSIGASGKFTMQATSDWLRNLRSFSIGQWSFTGNAGALPTVVYLRFSLSNNDRQHMVINAAEAPVPTFSSNVTVPLMAPQNGLSSELRVISTAQGDSPLSLNGVSLFFETIGASGTLTEFKDFTSFVCEFECEQQPTPGRKLYRPNADL